MEEREREEKDLHYLYDIASAVDSCDTTFGDFATIFTGDDHIVASSTGSHLIRTNVTQTTPN